MGTETEAGREETKVVSWDEYLSKQSGNSFPLQFSVANNLKQIVTAYHQYLNEKGSAPASAADFAPLLEKSALDRLENKSIVFVYGVTLKDLKAGMSETIIAYEKDAPKQGGSVAFVDGSVRKVTAEEFKQAVVPEAPKK